MPSLMQLLNQPVPLSQRSVENSQVDAGARVLGVALAPGFIGLNRLLGFASHNMVVKSGNFVLFPFTEFIAQIVGFLGILSSETGLVHQGVMRPQRLVSHREIRIQFNRTLVKRDGGGAAGLARSEE